MTPLSTKHVRRVDVYGRITTTTATKGGFYEFAHELSASDDASHVPGMPNLCSHTARLGIWE